MEGDAWIGEKLDKGKLDKMSGELLLSFNWSYCLSVGVVWGRVVCANWEIDQQIGQLYELMQAIQNKDGEGEGEGEKQ